MSDGKLWGVETDRACGFLLVLVREYGGQTGESYDAFSIAQILMDKEKSTWEEVVTFLGGLEAADHIRFETLRGGERDKRVELKKEGLRGLLMYFKSDISLIMMEAYLQDHRKHVRQFQKLDKEWPDKMETMMQELRVAKDSVPEIARQVVGDSVQEELKRTGAIGGFLQEVQKDLFQYMALFVAIFSVLGLNINSAGKWTVQQLLKLNLILVASLTTLIALLSVIAGPVKKRTYVLIGLAILLWGIASMVIGLL